MHEDPSAVPGVPDLTRCPLGRTGAFPFALLPTD
jgi:hypothetical protein